MSHNVLAATIFIRFYLAPGTARYRLCPELTASRPPSPLIVLSGGPASSPGGEQNRVGDLWTLDVAVAADKIVSPEIVDFLGGELICGRLCQQGPLDELTRLQLHRAVSADSAERVVLVPQRDRVCIVARKSGGNRIGDADRLVVRGMGREDRPIHFRLRNDLPEKAIGLAIEVLGKTIVREGALQQRQAGRPNRYGPIDGGRDDAG